MYATREQGCRYWTRHLQRYAGLPSISALSGMKKRSSAQYKGSANLPPQTAYRQRLAVNAQGQVAMTSGVLIPLNAHPGVMLAQQTTSSDELFLQHKSSIRQRYDESSESS